LPALTAERRRLDEERRREGKREKGTGRIKDENNQKIITKHRR